MERCLRRSGTDCSQGRLSPPSLWMKRPVMAERGIPHAWVERAIAAPVRRAQDPYDEAVERFFLRIEERDGRVLRVAVNTESDPWRVVSAFFDRSARGNA